MVSSIQSFRLSDCWHTPPVNLHFHLHFFSHLVSWIHTHSSGPLITPPDLEFDAWDHLCYSPTEEVVSDSDMPPSLLEDSPLLCKGNWIHHIEAPGSNNKEEPSGTPPISVAKKTPTVKVESGAPSTSTPHTLTLYEFVQLSHAMIGIHHDIIEVLSEEDDISKTFFIYKDLCRLN
ncbi:hypothetical protein FRB91_000392 [Serendipita sp. 411]|nr:hypothetical protein FRB91_000392 [Serendipita sp. 411]